MDLTNTKLVTHANCPDGLACAIVFISAGGQRNNVVFSSPNHKFVDEKVKDLLGSSSGVDIIIADLSVSEQLAEVIENAYKNVLDPSLLEPLKGNELNININGRF